MHNFLSFLLITASPGAPLPSPPPTCRPPPAFVLLFGRPGISFLLHGTPLSAAIHAYKHRGFIWAFYSGGGPTNRGASLPTLLFPLPPFSFLPFIYPPLFLPLASLVLSPPLSLSRVSKTCISWIVFPDPRTDIIYFSLFAPAWRRLFSKLAARIFPQS